MSVEHSRLAMTFSDVHRSVDEEQNRTRVRKGETSIERHLISIARHTTRSISREREREREKQKEEEGKRNASSVSPFPRRSLSRHFLLDVQIGIDE